MIAGYDHNQIFQQGQALHFGHHLAHQCREKIRHDVVRCMRESGQQYNEDNRREMCCYIWTAQDCAKREAKAKCTSVEKRALEENVWKNVHQYNENDCEQYHYHAITCSGAHALDILYNRPYSKLQL
ncbi:unnamed protein product [Medioppia subpectinata]|uniref:Uncharacterized protein n=1 Tax=Medioppia subpectinata TaxID=1979941 RepID=A0A7R9KEX2_9ACAR|nr:unnamed protein product [Medioppia subpectinata]CAG2102080.1 unnamed protein product [Medioppia subpectinata]